VCQKEKMSVDFDNKEAETELNLHICKVGHGSNPPLSASKTAK
jgi:hypothetical protein